MKESKLTHLLLKEAVLKLDFVKNEFEIGWFWVIIILLNLIRDLISWVQ